MNETMFNMGRVITLLLVVVYSIAIFNYGFTIEYGVIIAASLISFMSIVRFTMFLEDASLGSPNAVNKPGFFFGSFGLISVLGGLNIYLFLAKGLYGFYEVYESFSIKSLIFQLAVFFIIYKLTVASSYIQKIYLNLKAI